MKKSLLLHYLTCGIYSVRQSGGTQGFWKGVRENFATLVGYPEPQPTTKLRKRLLTHMQGIHSSPAYHCNYATHNQPCGLVL